MWWEFAEFDDVYLWWQRVADVFFCQLLAKRVLREVCIMRRLIHPYIISCKWPGYRDHRNVLALECWYWWYFCCCSDGRLHIKELGETGFDGLVYRHWICRTVWSYFLLFMSWNHALESPILMWFILSVAICTIKRSQCQLKQFGRSSGSCLCLCTTCTLAMFGTGKSILFSFTTKFVSMKNDHNWVYYMF